MYNLFHEMVNIFRGADGRHNDFGEGFISSWEHRAGSHSTTDAHVQGTHLSQSMTVLYKPPSGILNQRKYLPIRFMPITIELSLVHVNLRLKYTWIT